MTRYSRIIGIIAALGSSALSFGCNDAEPPAESVEETGSISAAITTLGPDGATYAMPSGTSLRVIASSWEAWFPLDGAGTSFTQSLPAGDYTLELYFPGEPHLI